MTTRPEKLLRWFIFGVLISLMPLALAYFGLRLDRRPASLEILLARGELLLICTTISAAALGELIPGGREDGIRKLLAAGCSTMVVVLSSVYFAAIQSRHSLDTTLVTAVSLWLFAGTLLAAGSCLYLAHQEVE